MIDLDALRRIAKGDPDTKITVRRAWLAAVLGDLEELDAVRTPPKSMLDKLTEQLDGFLKTR
jgi:hypothetical protein